MKYIKHIAIAALFVIGAAEMLMPFGIAMMFYAFSPQTRRVFVTAEQQQLFQKIHASIYAKGQTVFYLGIGTVVIGILLLVADRSKRTMPNSLVQRMRDSRCCLQFGRQWSRTADHRR